jgi:hypothetical protein
MFIAFVMADTPWIEKSPGAVSTDGAYLNWHVDFAAVAAGGDESAPVLPESIREVGCECMASE